MNNIIETIATKSKRESIKAFETMLAEKYPIEAAYNSKESLWGCGFREGLISLELYELAKGYYGRLWDYVGD
jgi:hypothetical protein